MLVRNARNERCCHIGWKLDYLRGRWTGQAEGDSEEHLIVRELPRQASPALSGFGTSSVSVDEAVLDLQR